jgi:hypothetical protein
MSGRLAKLTLVTGFLIVLMEYVICVTPWKWNGLPDTFWILWPELILIQYLDTGETYWSLASGMRHYSFEPRPYDVTIAFPTLWLLAGLVFPTLTASLSILGEIYSRPNHIALPEPPLPAMGSGARGRRTLDSLPEPDSAGTR